MGGPPGKQDLSVATHCPLQFMFKVLLLGPSNTWDHLAPWMQEKKSKPEGIHFWISHGPNILTPLGPSQCLRFRYQHLLEAPQHFSDPQETNTVLGSGPPTPTLLSKHSLHPLCSCTSQLCPVSSRSRVTGEEAAIPGSLPSPTLDYKEVVDSSLAGRSAQTLEQGGWDGGVATHSFRMGI